MPHVLTFACCVFLLGLLTGASSRAADDCTPGNLLAGAAPHPGAEVIHPERLSDGVVVAEGYRWGNQTSALVLDAPLQFDLRRPTRLRALWLQGDHPGGYLIRGSHDGAQWFSVWQSEPVEQHGMRTRQTSALDHTLRYLRIEPPRAGSAYALSEVAAFCEVPAAWPPAFSVQAGHADPELRGDPWSFVRHVAQHRLALALFGVLALIGSLTAARRYSGVSLRAAGVMVGALTLYCAYRAGKQAAPLEQAVQWVGVLAFAALPLCLIGLEARRQRAWARLRLREGTLALAAALCAGIGALVYAVAIAALYKTHSANVLVVVCLAAAALLAALAQRARRGRHWHGAARRVALVCVAAACSYAFVNFGTYTQWRYLVRGDDHRASINTADAWGLLDYKDQYHYYLGAKYFPELGYDKLYHCTAVAELDNGGAEALAGQHIRDLASNTLVPAETMLTHPEPCRSAFTPQRWRAFRADVAYFHSRMDDENWLRTLIDHGYNATPFWTAANHLLVAPTQASEATTFALAMIDVALYAAVFALLGWAFGLEAAALALVLWSLSSIWMYVQHGFGTFGRKYEICAAVAACCLMKKHYHALGGGMLALAALLRVFPGALFFGPAVQALASLSKRRRRPVVVRVFAGAAVVFALLVPFSLAITGGIPGQQAFIDNSLKHAATPLTNYMGLKTIFASSAESMSGRVVDAKADDPYSRWKRIRIDNFDQRRAFYWIAVAALLALSAYACWLVRAPWQAAIIGLLPMFCLFELTNYYYAFLILLAPLALGGLDRIAVLLAMLTLGHVLNRGSALVVYPAYSVIVLAVLLYFVAALILEARRAQAAIARAPARESARADVALST